MDLCVVYFYLPWLTFRVCHGGHLPSSCLFGGYAFTLAHAYSHDYLCIMQRLNAWNFSRLVVYLHEVTLFWFFPRCTTAKVMMRWAARSSCHSWRKTIKIILNFAESDLMIVPQDTDRSTMGFRPERNFQKFPAKRNFRPIRKPRAQFLSLSLSVKQMWSLVSSFHHD